MKVCPKLNDYRDYIFRYYPEDLQEEALGMIKPNYSSSINTSAKSQVSEMQSLRIFLSLRNMKIQK